MKRYLTYSFTAYKSTPRLVTASESRPDYSIFPDVNRYDLLLMKIDLDRRYDRYLHRHDHKPESIEIPSSAPPTRFDTPQPPTPLSINVPNDATLGIPQAARRQNAQPCPVPQQTLLMHQPQATYFHTGTSIAPFDVSSYSRTQRPDISEQPVNTSDKGSVASGVDASDHRRRTTQRKPWLLQTPAFPTGNKRKRGEDRGILDKQDGS